MTTSEEKISSLALRVEAARQVVVAARKKRAALRCLKHEVETDVGLLHCDSDGVPCWKRWEQDPYDGDSWRPDKDEWCQHCLDREVAHEEYSVAARKLGTLRGTLTRACQRQLASDRVASGAFRSRPLGAA